MMLKGGCFSINFVQKKIGKNCDFASVLPILLLFQRFRVCFGIQILNIEFFAVTAFYLCVTQNSACSELVPDLADFSVRLRKCVRAV